MCAAIDKPEEGSAGRFDDVAPFTSPLSVSVLRTDPPLPRSAGERIGALNRCLVSFRSRAVPPPAGDGPSARARHKARRTVVLAACGRTHFTVATPRFRSGFCQRTLLATGEEVGKRGAWPCLSSFNTWRSFRAPPVFLPCRRTGPLPLVSVKARTWGFITQQRTATPPARHRPCHARSVRDPRSRAGDGGSIAYGQGT